MLHKSVDNKNNKMSSEPTTSYSDGEIDSDSDTEFFTKKLSEGSGFVSTNTKLASLASRINVSVLTPNEAGVITGQAQNKFNVSIRKQDENRIRIKDKSDRATTELVMDSRTRIILLKLIKKELLDEVSGCISTGKEANVYHAVDAQDKEYAVKIYKTSILVFKDRDRYVAGEFRFRKGYCRHNPRKMVTMWAEKEFRNLNRMKSAGIAVPQPVAVKGHILVMEFLGKHMIAASTLKEAVFTTLEEWEQLYISVVEILRRMYQDCKLVHADFSEYNILLYEGKVYVIDVSQAVEHDHPMALEFLRRDCANINAFFESRGVTTLGLKQIFYLIIEQAFEFSREYAQKLLAERKTDPKKEENKFDDELFKNLYIPRTLFEVEPEKLADASPDQLVSTHQSKVVGHNKASGRVQSQKRVDFFQA
eukprot:TRINITY_DN2308_c0_g1_i1.p3 TRINITY_DN2308_c0_g1~~TRINITY_DN2308_c0_g1_i1.p3  ORF type:complete len:421 (-),score=41.11 TRINITY_DN2308_c0_g1_i1:4409-5671(-)